jgi:uncharacterized membrane protein (DUF485 family)
MFRLSVINPSAWILIYKKEVLPVAIRLLRSKLISYTVAYLAIPLLINNNGDVIDFPVVLMTSVLSFYKRKTKGNKEHYKWDLLHSVCIME